MLALDTNVLVRFLVDDDPEQANRAAALIDDATQKNKRLFVSQIVLCELVWVLRAAYRRSKAEILVALRRLMMSRQLHIEEPALAMRALHRYATGQGDFADYLIAQRAQRAGFKEVATFDKKLLKEKGFVPP